MEGFETWCWRRVEKISWTDCVKNEVLLRMNDEKNIIHKYNGVGLTVRRNCLLKHVTERKI
jgi:hypothetical protein